MKQFLFVLLSICLCNASFVKEFEKLRFTSQQKTSSDGKIWVLLVAGSNGYYNYRHQADVCHSYQVVHNHGIPDEQIVVMMYDDIAYADENPTQGIIINHPDGKDVYHGVPKDYTMDDVTPKNFLSVLTGNAQAMKNIGSGKVIASGPNDHVFVYFADHGAPGLIAFPSQMLLKDDLNNAIMKMYNNNQYAQMVIYIEACESGSMFDGILKDNINVYATTAANPDESSYACYYDDKRQTYLGDRYSVSWLEDSDKENIESETLSKQYKVVKADTTTSHVMEYGNMTMSGEVVGMFQGEEKSTVAPKQLREIRDDVPSPDVPIHILRHRAMAAKTDEEKQKYKTLLRKEQEIRRRIEWSASTVAEHVSDRSRSLISFTEKKPKLTDMECYKSAIAAFDSHCFDLDKYEYAYRQLYVLGNLCDAGYPTNKILDAIALVC